METIGGRVQALRSSKRMTQRQLADACNVSQPTIANIERGRTTEIKGFVLDALAVALGSTASYILHGIPEGTNHEQAMLYAEMKAIFHSLSQADQESLVHVARGLLQLSETKASKLNPFPKTPLPKKAKMPH